MRLKPNEFLNDTLIEFALKYVPLSPINDFALTPDRVWLNELKEKDPELADQIHVFSSFFYKKLRTGT